MTPVDGLERRRAFCARLKAERERRGTTLSAIADATKVKASLLDALERGDISHWPKGIYRRSFFREYVAAFGLAPEPYAAEFLELFPDGEDDVLRRPTAPAATPPPAAPQAPASTLASSLRLTLAHEEFSRWTAPLKSWPGAAAGYVQAQWLAALVDLALVVGVAFAIAAFTSVSVELAAAVLGGIYYSLGTALLGHTPASWWAVRVSQPAALGPEPSAPSARSTPQRMPVPQTDLRRLVGQTLRARSAVRDYVIRLSDSKALMGGGRRRDMAQLRRRRVDAANGAVDEPI
jgi:transcriptional regulator with XRE-family HTH domain